MKVVIDSLRQRATYTLNCRQIAHTGPRNRFGRSKALEQGLLAQRSYACNLVQRTYPHCLCAPCPVAANGKTMRLIPEPLDIVEDRIARRQHEGRLARHEEMLAARIPVRSLGH